MQRFRERHIGAGTRAYRRGRTKPVPHMEATRYP